MLFSFFLVVMLTMSQSLWALAGGGLSHYGRDMAAVLGKKDVLQDCADFSDKKRWQAVQALSYEKHKIILEVMMADPSAQVQAAVLARFLQQEDYAHIEKFFSLILKSKQFIKDQTQFLRLLSDSKINWSTVSGWIRYQVALWLRAHGNEAKAVDWMKMLTRNADKAVRIVALNTLVLWEENEFVENYYTTGVLDTKKYAAYALGKNFKEDSNLFVKMPWHYRLDAAVVQRDGDKVWSQYIALKNVPEELKKTGVLAYLADMAVFDGQGLEELKRVMNDGDSVLAYEAAKQLGADAAVVVWAKTQWVDMKTFPDEHKEDLNKLMAILGGNGSQEAELLLQDMVSAVTTCKDQEVSLSFLQALQAIDTKAAGDLIVSFQGAKGFNAETMQKRVASKITYLENLSAVVLKTAA